jgi:hypothetical protein
MRSQHDRHLRPRPFGPTPHSYGRSRRRRPHPEGVRSRLVMLPGRVREPDSAFVKYRRTGRTRRTGSVWLHRWENGPAGRAVPQAPSRIRARPARPRDHPAAPPVAGWPRRASTAPPVHRTAHRRSPGQALHHDGHHREDHRSHRDADHHGPSAPRRQPLRPVFATSDPMVIVGLRPDPVSLRGGCTRLIIVSIHELPNERPKDQKQHQSPRPGPARRATPARAM